MKDSRSGRQQIAEGIIIAGVVLAGKAAGLFTSGAKPNYPVLVLAAIVLVAVFVRPWVRQWQNKKLRRRVAPVPMTVPNQAEGGPGPSQLGTGDSMTTRDQHL